MATYTPLPKPERHEGYSTQEIVDALFRVPPPPTYHPWWDLCVGAHRAGIPDETIEAWCASDPAHYRPGEWLREKAPTIDRYDAARWITAGTIIAWLQGQGALIRRGADITARPPLPRDHNDQPVFRTFRPITPQQIRDAQDPEWLVPDILPQGGSAIIHGLPKQGKTTLLNIWATRDHWLGRDISPGLWCHFTEESPLSLKVRYRRLGIDTDLLTARKRLLHFERVLDEQWTADDYAQELFEYYQKESEPKPVCFVVDTMLRWLRVDDINDAAAVVRLLDPFNQLSRLLPDLALVMVHQSRKTGGTAVTSLSGSTQLAAAFDTVLHLEHNGNDGSVLEVEGRFIAEAGRYEFYQSLTPAGVNYEIGTASNAALEEIVRNAGEEGITLSGIRDEMIDPPSNNTLTARLKKLGAIAEPKGKNHANHWRFP